jgi:hypothetical protein
MKGIGFIGLLIAMIIVAILTIQSIKRSAAAQEKASGVEIPKDLTTLPNQIKKKLDDATKQADQAQKKALEGVE